MKIGFIGTGNMGGAILKGYSTVAEKNGDELLAFNRTPAKVKAIAEKYKITPCDSMKQLIDGSDVIILGVKPNMYEQVLPELAEDFSKGKILVSMAAGISIGFIEKYLGSEAKVVRIMPNTPAQVGEAMTSVSRNGNVGDDIYPRILDIFRGIGEAEDVPEELIHCVIGVSGSSPAYTYMYIDALAKSAVKNGMDPEKAKTFAAQAVLGAAKMVLDSDETPEQLRINVCSPGGTTIEAVNTLFNNGFEENVSEGFQAAVEKSKVMTK
ncbi:MAG: pyrroline-5-carboxylate reductase [Eubacteriaceae bacterium]|nr:pyrroline-5-carboxylate reductase [Eubacteriaceae bacterium]